MQCSLWFGCRISWCQNQGTVHGSDRMLKTMFFKKHSIVCSCKRPINQLTLLCFIAFCTTNDCEFWSHGHPV